LINISATPLFYPAKMVELLARTRSQLSVDREYSARESYPLFSRTLPCSDKYICWTVDLVFILVSRQKCQVKRFPATTVNTLGVSRSVWSYRFYCMQIRLPGDWISR